MSISARRRTALLTVFIATLVGLVFILAGDALVDLFHIEEPAFLIAAGLIVVVFSIRMVIEDGQHTSTGEGDESESALRLAVYPLSVPTLRERAAMQLRPAAE